MNAVEIDWKKSEGDWEANSDSPGDDPETKIGWGLLVEKEYGGTWSAMASFHDIEYGGWPEEFDSVALGGFSSVVAAKGAAEALLRTWKDTRPNPTLREAADEIEDAGASIQPCGLINLLGRDLGVEGAVERLEQIGWERFLPIRGHIVIGPKQEQGPREYLLVCHPDEEEEVA